jgi:hypothetical protein
MNRFVAPFCGLLFACLSPTSLQATTDLAETMVTFHSTSSGVRYGLVLTAPPLVACPIARVRVSRAGLAPTHAQESLAGGETRVLRLGQGFAAGPQVLRVQVLGCAGISHLRLVRLGRPGPGHGWARVALSP